IRMNAPGTVNWSLVTGQITDPNGNPLPAVPVAVVPDATANPGIFQPFEKVTDALGQISLLLPVPGKVEFFINSPVPQVGSVNGQYPSTHYYDPHYASKSFKQTIPSTAPGQIIPLGTAGSVPPDTQLGLSQNMILALSKLKGKVFYEDGVTPVQGQRM